MFATRRRPALWALALIILVTLAVTLAAAPRQSVDPTTLIAELINPQKLATLKARGANPRVQKSVYWLATAQKDGQNVTTVAAAAVKLAGYTNSPAAALTRDALLRNLDIATKLGCINPAGLADMCKGQSPTIQKGPYAKDELSVDHIIPRAVCPELDNVISNLELMPLRLNESKNAKVGERQLQKAREFNRAGLLSAAALRRVQSAFR